MMILKHNFILIAGPNAINLDSSLQIILPPKEKS